MEDESVAIINISTLPCISEPERLKRLQDHILVNRSLMPHNIAAVTGCDPVEAMSFLLLLYGKEVANGLSVYITIVILVTILIKGLWKMAYQKVEP